MCKLKCQWPVSLGSVVKRANSDRILPICRSVLTFCKTCSLHYCNQYFIFLLQNTGYRLSDVGGQYNDSFALETVPEIKYNTGEWVTIYYEYTVGVYGTQTINASNRET